MRRPWSALPPADGRGTDEAYGGSGGGANGGPNRRALLAAGGGVLALGALGALLLMPSAAEPASVARPSRPGVEMAPVPAPTPTPTSTLSGSPTSTPPGGGGKGPRDPFAPLVPVEVMTAPAPGLSGSQAQLSTSPPGLPAPLPGSPSGSFPDLPPGQGVPPGTVGVPPGPTPTAPGSTLLPPGTTPPASPFPPPAAPSPTPTPTQSPTPSRSSDSRPGKERPPLTLRLKVLDVGADRSSARVSIGGTRVKVRRGDELVGHVRVRHVDRHGCVGFSYAASRFRLCEGQSTVLR